MWKPYCAPAYYWFIIGLLFYINELLFSLYLPLAACRAGRTPPPHPSAPAGLLTWRHFQLKAHQRVEGPGAIAHAPVPARVLAPEGHHGDVDHLVLDVVLQQVAWPLHPATGEARLTLLPPDFAPHLALHAVFAVLIGALYRQSLPFQVPHFGVHALGRDTWGDTTC